MTHATLGVYTSPRPKGFAPWKPQAKARELVESIEAVLAEYAAYLPITVRQIFYNLVSRGFLEKTDRAYAGLCEAANRARRAGLLPWNAFRDDGTTARVAAAYETPSAFLSALRRYVTDDYRRPRLTGQARALEVWSEAAGMVPQLERVCDPYGVAVYSSGGFDSLTAKHETASRLADESRPYRHSPRRGPRPFRPYHLRRARGRRGRLRRGAQ